MLDKETCGTIVDMEDNVVVRGGFQCDDMGLGKTIQIAATMVNHPVKETLLVAPLAMLDTWIEVLQRAGMSVYEVKGTWVKRASNYGVPRHFIKMRPHVYVCNYEKLSRPLFSRSWGRVVLDEAHKIRTASGKVAAAARRIVAPIRWAVTGTPLVNSLKDVVSLLAFVGVPCGETWEKRFHELFPLLTLHRSLDSIRSVIQGAPPVPVIHEEVLPFVTEDEDDFYHGVQGRHAKYASEYLSAAEMFKLLLRLRQLSVHPQVYINAKRREGPYDREDWVGATTKLERLGEIVGETGSPAPAESATGSPAPPASLETPTECRTPTESLETASPCRPPKTPTECRTPTESLEGLHKYIVFCQFKIGRASCRERVSSPV